MIEELQFPNGGRLLEDWKNGDASSRKRLQEIFDATIAGEYDAIFSEAAPANKVHCSASVNLMTLSIMHDLYGLDSAAFYKGDPERYVRTTLMSRKLLGMNKMYLSWVVYAFTAEAMGQSMTYPEEAPPGVNPSDLLINRDNWQDIQTPDMHSGIPRILDETLDCYQRLTGFEPVLHLSAPYSLAADIYGQEQIILELSDDPDFVNDFLDLLVDRVLAPWIDHFMQRFPKGWVELSDAPGSPFFIGPDNFKNIAVRTVQRLIDENPWGNRVYDANYRGDYVALVDQNRDGRSRRRTKRGNDHSQNLSLEELLNLKTQACPDFVIRLNDDRLPVHHYVEHAIKKNIPLFMGIGVSEIDRHRTIDQETLRATASDYVQAVKNVAATISQNGYTSTVPPWPGTIYFEDISAESDFNLVEIIIDTANREGGLDNNISAQSQARI
jgi:hypothetical protein